VDTCNASKKFLDHGGVVIAIKYCIKFAFSQYHWC